MGSRTEHLQCSAIRIRGNSAAWELVQEKTLNYVQNAMNAMAQLIQFGSIRLFVIGCAKKNSSLMLQGFHWKKQAKTMIHLLQLLTRSKYVTEEDFP